MEPNVNNYHLIQAYWVGATNFKPGHIKLYSLRFKEHIKIDTDYDYESITPDCLIWFKQHGFKILGKGEALQGYIFISDTFKPLSELKPVMEKEKAHELVIKEWKS